MQEIKYIKGYLSMTGKIEALSGSVYGENMKQNNYENMRDQMQERFLLYDQQKMIEKFVLKHDTDYLYIRFVGRDYRIDRNSGRTEWTEDGFVNCTLAGYNEAMSIYDVLCDSKADCRLSGNFQPVNRLKGTVQSSGNGPGSFYQNISQYFDGKTELLCKACENLGGIKKQIGDAAYCLYPFEFLPMMLQFWESDEEFPAQLKIMWDENVQDFVRYETTFFIAGHVLGRIRELMEKNE